VLSLGNVVAAEKIPVGGEAVNRSLIGYFRTHHELLFSPQSARQVHRQLHAANAAGYTQAEVQGRDVITGLARTVLTDCVAAQQAATGPMTAVLDGVRTVLRSCPPDLVADIGVRGVSLTGGNATMPGLEMLLRDAFGLPVHIADQPGNSAILGLGSMLMGTATPPADEDGTPLPSPPDEDPVPATVAED
jgi:rod shape-determining protein MreB